MDRPPPPRIAPAITVVQSLERGLAVIRAFDADHPRLTLAEVARRTDLSRATVRRFLHSLVTLGYMHTADGEFWLRPRILELGYAYLSSLGLPEIATPHLSRLSEEVEESSSVSVLDGTDVVYVARVAVRKIMAVDIRVGTRFPAWLTSMGRVILADLEPTELEQYVDRLDLVPMTPRTAPDKETLLQRIRSAGHDGYALNDQELELGLRSIAVGIRDTRGGVAAALNISVPSMRFDVDEIHERFLPGLQAARDAIESDLRARYPTGSSVPAW